MIGKGPLWWAMVGRDEKHLNYASYVVPGPCVPSVADTI